MEIVRTDTFWCLFFFHIKRDRNVKMGHTKISTDIEQNIRLFKQLLAESEDFKMKEMRLGIGK